MRILRITVVTAALAVSAVSANGQQPRPANPAAVSSQDAADVAHSPSTVQPAPVSLANGEELLPPAPPAAVPPEPALPPAAPLPPLHIAEPEFGFLAQAPKPPPMPRAPFGKRAALHRGSDSDEKAYRRGSSYLDKREWQNALESFREAAKNKGPRADGALYWQSYSLNKLGQRDEALKTLADLQREHPNSRWLNDAKALEVEIRQAAGKGLTPEQETDEDLKLFAINSLMHSDPERALPLLEKILKTQSSPRLKERALFVLAQSRAARAREVVADVAKGNANPDLQLKAVEYLGIHGGPENRKILSAIYTSNPDAAVRKRILHSFMVAGDKEALLRAARAEPNEDLRREAIHLLGVTGAETELVQLYQSEQSSKVRESILHALAIGNGAPRLLELIRTEKDPRLRGVAIQRIGITRRSQATTDALAGLYGSEQDKKLKQSILHALFIQGSAKALVDLARKENDPTLKREIVQRLSMMKSQEGTDYLMELLK